jgi:hypothetical protein
VEKDVVALDSQSVVENIVVCPVEITGAGGNKSETGDTSNNSSDRSDKEGLPLFLSDKSSEATDCTVNKIKVCASSNLTTEAVDSSENKCDTSDSSNKISEASDIGDKKSRVIAASNQASEKSNQNSESTNSLSSVSTDISGERSQNLVAKLDEVRQGIYRLLSESDNGEIEEEGDTAETIDTHRQVVEKKTVTKTETIIKSEIVSRKEETNTLTLNLQEEEIRGYQADEEVDLSDSVDQAMVPRSENIIEVEVERNMGCLSGERETRDREERCTDSGIERGVESSRGGSAEGWLARLSYRVTGKSKITLGSGGQSSHSQASTDGSKECFNSPRDGGFGERNQELKVKLAQMEEEKLRAVQLAVEIAKEEEKRIGEDRILKERSILDREREQWRKEIEELRNEHVQAALQNEKKSKESQDRQAEMVNKLQVRVLCHCLDSVSFSGKWKNR